VGGVGDVKENVVANLILAILFAASILAPFEPDGQSPRTYLWYAAFVAPDVMLWLMRRTQR
jgi:hypothetical protein